MTRQPKHFHDALHDFFCMARDRPQALVLRFFLEQVIYHSDLCQGGAILVNVPDEGSEGRGHLKLWDLKTEVEAINSLMTKDDEKKIHLPCDQGISTVAFRKRSPEFARTARDHPQYWWPENAPTEDIYSDGPVYAVPIKLLDRRNRREPLGVVIFQNAASKPMDETTLKNMDLSVKALEAMMSISPRKLADENKVFIVHGRNQEHLDELQDILKAEKLNPVVIASKARTGADLLGFLEDEIRNCLAGFILLTPDDEGRLYKYGEELCQRARQNVIFEAGYLTAVFRDTNRICFLKKGDLEIPSDLSGLLMETFEESIDRERIHQTLRQWRIANPALDNSTQSPASGSQHSEVEPATTGSGAPGTQS